MKFFCVLATMIVVLGCSLAVSAGQGYIVNEDGDPVIWDASASAPISVHPESGACGQFTNTEMVTRLTSNLEAWTDITTVDLAFDIRAGVLGSVDACNYTDYLAGVNGNTSAESQENVQDGINPILFDNNGELIEAASGENNGRYTILGFANPAGFSTSQTDSSLYINIVDGQAVFNCYCLEDASGNPAHSDCSPTVFTTDDLDFTMIHELGHFMNLDHTQVNSDDTSYLTLPAMFPVSLDAGEQKSPNEDDKVALSGLYPKSSFNTTYCRVTGTLKDRFGQAMRCADIQAIDSADDTYNVAFVSGAYAPAVDNDNDADTADDNECQSNCGDFELHLRPGRTYTLKSVPVESSFVGGSGISPCANSQLPECTAALIAACTDDNTSTTCRACVKEETLTTNDSAANITNKILSECTAGATVTLGNITGNSIGIIAADTETLIKPPAELADAETLEERLLPGAGEAYADYDCSESGGSSGSGSSSGCSLNGAAGPVSFFGLVYYGICLILLSLRLTVIGKW